MVPTGHVLTSSRLLLGVAVQALYHEPGVELRYRSLLIKTQISNSPYIVNFFFFFFFFTRILELVGGGHRPVTREA